MSYLDILCDGDGVFQLDPKKPDGAVHFGVTRKQLNGPQIACLSVDLCDLSPTN